MAAIVPAGATFLVFTDYARPAMRIAALAGIPVDLRDDPRFHRPGRGRPDPPAGRASGRAPRHAEDAGVPPGRRHRDGGMLADRARAHGRAERPRADPPEPAAGRARTAATATSARRGAYELSPANGKARATIFASGSRGGDRARGARSFWPNRASRFASCRCRRSTCSWRSPRRSRHEIIGDAPIKVAVEAAVRFGWDAVIGSDGIFVGMNGFRRERALQGSLQAFRHHRRGRGGKGPQDAQSVRRTSDEPRRTRELRQ